MGVIDQLISFLEPHLDILQVFAIILVSFVIFSIILRLIKRSLLKKVKSKKQRSNVTIFLDLLRVLFFFFLIMAVVFYYYGKLGDLGFFAGLMTVALGWALQKPISGVVAWLILVTRRPIHIGDRVIIKKIKGDITNITLTHILLEEVGGTIDGEEKSGRTIMIPTSIIFEEEVVNYTEHDDYILDEIITAITYESDLHRAEEIITNAVCVMMEPFWSDFPKRISKEPHIRLAFRDSGIDVSIRYYTLALKRNEIATKIRREIWTHIQQEPLVEFAYPHSEVLFREKKTTK